ncbi:MAG: hypothetical protein GQF41_0403 [Candidatus Rifleibacterium amylolyticum]|nr:MAG: hypothetical protein GQF41_0403 [Candidatus Rifleibacterium amylolyticum]
MGRSFFFANCRSSNRLPVFSLSIETGNVDLILRAGCGTIPPPWLSQIAHTQA